MFHIVRFCDIEYFKDISLSFVFYPFIMPLHLSYCFNMCIKTSLNKPLVSDGFAKTSRTYISLKGNPLPFHDTFLHSPHSTWVANAKPSLQYPGLASAL